MQIHRFVMANEKEDKVKLTKSKSCGRISSGLHGLSGSQSGLAGSQSSTGINSNSAMRKSTRQRQAGRTKQQYRIVPLGTGRVGLKLCLVLGVDLLSTSTTKLPLSIRK